MSVLNHIDRFIASLWERNDQLSVYNPQIKTQYDTYSWLKDIPRDPVEQKTALRLYKLDLLDSLTQNDNFPLTYYETARGSAFMRWALGRDIRNMLRWIRGPKGQGGPQAIKDTNGTYGAVISKVIDDSISLDTREYQNNGDGFRYSEFVDIVRQGFKPGKPPVSIFGGRPEDDYDRAASNYFWFMYGILPRNGIMLQSLINGLTLPDPNDVDTRNTFKFLGLLYNLKSKKIQILKGPDRDGKPDVEGIYEFIDPWKEIPRPFDHEVMYIDTRNELHQRQEKDKPKDDNNDKLENDKTKRLQREIDELNRRVKDYIQQNPGWKSNANQKKKVDGWNKEKGDKQTELNAERNRLKVEKRDGNIQKKVDEPRREPAPRRESTPPRRESPPPRQESPPPQRESPPPQRQNTPARQSEPRRKRQDEVTSSSPPTPVPTSSSTSIDFPLLDDDVGVQSATTSETTAPTQTGGTFRTRNRVPSGARTQTRQGSARSGPSSRSGPSLAPAAGFRGGRPSSTTAFRGDPSDVSRTMFR